MVMLNEQIMMGSGDEEKSGESSEVGKPETSTDVREPRRVSEADKDDKPPSLSPMVGESSKDGPNPGSLQLQQSSEGRQDQKPDVQPQPGGISSYEEGTQPLDEGKLPPSSVPKDVEAKEGSDSSEKKGGALSRLSSYETLEEALKGKRSPQDSIQTVPSAPLPTSKNVPPVAHETATSKVHSRTNSAPPKVITTVRHVPAQSNSPSGNSTSSRKQASNLRRGKWTVEEEAYVARVIQDFNSGFLDAPAGTTLRTYLSEKLQCDPMRITKKFTGDACIGKRVFHPAVRSPSNAAAIDKAQAELEALEKRWRRRLEMQQRESAKKAAASAAAAAVVTGLDASGFISVDSSAHQAGGTTGQNVVAQTASWLDRAKSVLSDPSKSDPVEHTNKDLEGLPQSEIMSQMQEVQRLIHEGPVIQQSSAGIPQYLDQAEQRATGTSSPDPEPADKRMRTGAEDAEALVGFLRSVRASAANGQDF